MAGSFSTAFPAQPINSFLNFADKYKFYEFCRRTALARDDT